MGGKKVIGFFDKPDEIENLWLDGTGHMASAYFTVGNMQRGYFYANQMDPFLIDVMMGDKLVRGLPYTANRKGGYDWVDLKKPFVSVACWYIFAKNHFNPLLLTARK